MKKLVEFYGGEPWFDNPLLVTASNPRRKTSMRKNSKRRARRADGRFTKARSNFYSAGALANKKSPKRRRARKNVYFTNRKRTRRYKRNPGMLGGFALPPMQDVLFTTAGLIGPGMVSAQLLKVLPTSLTSSAIAQWAVKAVSVFLPGMLIRKFVNQRAGNLFMVGGSAGLAMDAIRTFAPGIIPGLGSQPLLGSYFGRPVGPGQQIVPFARPRQGGLPSQIADAPERLSPQGRF